MKRIILWVDTENSEVSQTLKNLKKFLNTAATKYSIVDVCEIAELGDSK
ncbi:MAG TPA: hypothetical protein VEH86_07660 [Candidatus Acidoferrum sp.]|nr:hypothetical protein [Candidatus Acidoferrum sp.]